MFQQRTAGREEETPLRGKCSGPIKSENPSEEERDPLSPLTGAQRASCRGGESRFGVDTNRPPPTSPRCSYCLRTSLNYGVRGQALNQKHPHCTFLHLYPPALRRGPSPLFYGWGNRDSGLSSSTSMFAQLLGGEAGCKFSVVSIQKA